MTDRSARPTPDETQARAEQAAAAPDARAARDHYQRVGVDDDEPAGNDETHD